MSDFKKTLNRYWKLIKRVKWKVVGPLAIACILVVYLVISLIVGLFTKIPEKKTVEINTNLCGLNAKKTLEVVANEDRENPVMLKDYNFYGESLNLYYENYSVGIYNSETLVGKTVSLVDLCTGSEIRFDISANEDGDFTVDNQIELGKLTPGTYAVYIVEGETSRRVAMSTTILRNNTFTTVVREDKRLQVELLADKTMFDSKEPEEGEESKLDKNYLYIKVTEVASAETNSYDVVISVAPALTETGVSVTGETTYGYKESELLWPVAEQLQTKLEEAGLKVAILKETNDQEILYYGEDGILNKAYDLKAKYMLHLDVYDYGGKGIEYSSFSSGELAKTILEEVMSTTTFLPDSKYADSCGRYESSLTLQDYDGTYEIREAGGKVLGAGEYSASAQSNASFASDNIYGINTLVIMPAELKVQAEIENLANNGTAFADAVAKGFLNYINKK